MKSFFTTLMIALTLNGLAQSSGDQGYDSPLDFGFAIDRQSTSSGHSNFSTFGPSLTYGRSSLYIGALLEDRERDLRGFKLNYRFSPIAVGENCFPYFQYSLLSRWDSRLTKDLEKRLHHESWNGKAAERYRTVEHYLGFGLKTYVIGGGYVDLGIGLGFYDSKLTSDRDARIPDPYRYRRDTDVSLSLNGGIGYQF